MTSNAEFAGKPSVSNGQTDMTPSPTQADVVVEQRHRDAAQALMLTIWGDRMYGDKARRDEVASGQHDAHFVVQAFLKFERDYLASPPADGLRKALDHFPDDIQGVQSRIIIAHQLRASADIQDRETKRKTGWADTSDRAQLMRKAADTIEMLAALSAPPPSPEGDVSRAYDLHHITDVVQTVALEGADSPVDWGDAEDIARAVIAAMGKVSRDECICPKCGLRHGGRHVADAGF